MMFELTGISILGAAVDSAATRLPPTLLPPPLLPPHLLCYLYLCYSNDHHHILSGTTPGVGISIPASSPIEEGSSRNPSVI